jgi:hypothetical protein
VKWDKEVRTAIAHWGPALGVTIDPALVHAVIQRESSHVKLVADEPGGHKSYGPMMVYDVTARAYGVDPLALMVPAVGIYYGVRNLAEMLHTFPGDTSAAISAYNTGPARARRNAAGKFPNQSYVDAVRGFWKLYGGAAAGGGALLAVLAGVWLLLRSRARAR